MPKAKRFEPGMTSYPWPYNAALTSNQLVKIDGKGGVFTRAKLGPIYEVPPAGYFVLADGVDRNMVTKLRARETVTTKTPDEAPNIYHALPSENHMQAFGCGAVFLRQPIAVRMVNDQGGDKKYVVKRNPEDKFPGHPWMYRIPTKTLYLEVQDANNLCEVLHEDGSSSKDNTLDPADTSGGSSCTQQELQMPQVSVFSSRRNSPSPSTGDANANGGLTDDDIQQYFK
jgi:hypothetical protein